MMWEAFVRVQLTVIVAIVCLEIAQVLLKRIKLYFELFIFNINHSHFEQLTQQETNANRILTAQVAIA
jgi:hypothetical protein